jgi:octaprenyl-diphosphate synthase
VLKVIAFKDNDVALRRKQNGRISARSTLLLENYNHSDFKEALILMVNYVIERKK